MQLAGAIPGSRSPGRSRARGHAADQLAGAGSCSHVVNPFYFDYMTNNMGATVCKLAAARARKQPFC